MNNNKNMTHKAFLYINREVFDSAVIMMAGLIMDYSGVCLCSPSNFEAMEEQDLSYEEDADHLSFPGECKNLPIFLNTKEKWMETILQSNCIHRWLYLMEGIFRSNIDASSERLVISNLTNDLIDIYPYDNITSNLCYEFMLMLQQVKGGEYVKYDGEPYLFDPPRKEIFEDNGVPIFLCTPKRWTSVKVQVGVTPGSPSVVVSSKKLLSPVLVFIARLLFISLVVDG